MRLSIVIPCFNKVNFTLSCLKDLEQLPEDHELIFVDNASSDQTMEKLSINNRIVYIRNEQNLGFAGAVNIGYSVASSENIMFLNNDIRVKSNYNDWTKEIIESCNENYMVGPTMGKLDYALNFIKEDDCYLDGNSYMSGWCLASSKLTWKKLEIGRQNPKEVRYFHRQREHVKDVVQLFSEEYFAYFEDTDLSFRAKQLDINFKIVKIPVVHFGKVTTSQINTIKLYKDSRKIFINKWGKK